MKTERRHELQTNVLADRLARSAESVRPYGKTILGIVLLLLLAIVVLSFWNSQRRQKTIDGWDQFFTALSDGNESALQQTATDYKGTSVAGWAKLVNADIALSEATAQLFTDKADAVQKLRDTVDSYQTLRDAGNPVIEQRAAFGLAQAHESLGELDKAREEYESLAKRWPDSPYARIAKQRVTQLNQQSTKEFYDWFAKYTPSTPASRLPGTPGVAPNFDRGLDNELSPPRTGDVTFPSVLDTPPAAAGDAAADNDAEDSAAEDSASKDATAEEATIDGAAADVDPTDAIPADSAVPAPATGGVPEAGTDVRLPAATESDEPSSEDGPADSAGQPDASESK